MTKHDYLLAYKLLRTENACNTPTIFRKENWQKMTRYNPKAVTFASVSFYSRKHE